MELILDTANINEIKEIYNNLCIDGITTNPTIISKENKEFSLLIKEIDEVVGVDTPIHAQVVSTTYEEMMKEALYINSLRKNMYIKVPVTNVGYKVIKELKKQNIKVTATAVFTANQGYLAAKCGADYVAPYVNRIDNISGDGVKTVSDLVNILNTYNMNTKVLGASFKNANQVLELMKVGVHSTTLPFDIMKVMMNHPSTDISVDNFTKDFEKSFGEGSTTNKRG